MPFRLLSSMLGLFIVLMTLIVCSTGSMAQQDVNNKQSMTSEAAQTWTQIIPRETLIAFLNLKQYEAAIDTVSLCEGNDHCLSAAKDIRSLHCLVDTCNQTDKRKESVTCFGDKIAPSSYEMKERMDEALCAWVKSPGIETRRALITLNLASKNHDDVWTEDEAQILAFKGSAHACEDIIKNFVGGYGAQWSVHWYKALSGCRILARERTIEQEEKDFNTWFGVVRGLGNCSDIENIEMRNACNAPGAASPLPNDYGW